MTRASGILMHISSLTSRYGIGNFGESAYDFCDFLKDSGQTYWQLLPMGQTSYGDSPYQSFSSYAGNPYFIDFDTLIKEKILSRKDVAPLLKWEDGYVDYERLHNSWYMVLSKAFTNGYDIYKEEINDFSKKNAYWLDDYCLFMAVKKYYGGVEWLAWEDEEISLKTTEGVKKYTSLLERDINFFTFIQFLFFKQYGELKKYANNLGIKIIGDLPIYVALDSADCWGNRELFDLDESGKPLKVAGCPPDYFSATGQLWGNPLYNWEKQGEDGFEWFISRISHQLKMYDTLRIDHFRGFHDYWEIPYGDKTAQNGRWRMGPDIALFDAIREKLGVISVIAEDLGDLSDGVRVLLEKTKFPGMKILLFAFDGDENNPYLPHNYEKNCVCYLGTHDNDTALGWIKRAGDHPINFAKCYLEAKSKEELLPKMISGILRSSANLAIIQMQDLLSLDNSCRMNTPSTIGENWKWRLKKGQINKKLTKTLYTLTKTYGRIN